jgi:hypothetical protein
LLNKAFQKQFFPCTVLTVPRVQRGPLTICLAIKIVKFLFEILTAPKHSGVKWNGQKVN